MHLAHHPLFVALSILTAWLGSWTALDLFRRVRAHVGRWQVAWVVAAGVAMGLSIWSMHFIAMLGFSPGVPVRYDVLRTLLSLLLAIAATTCAFLLAREHRLPRVLLGGLLMGAGICTMHYVGMSALMTSVRLANNPAYVVLAFVVAITASSSALLVVMKNTTFMQRVLAAIVLGFAVVGMHYTAMLGIHAVHGTMAHVGAGGMDPIMLAIGIAAGTLFLLLLALIAAMSDRRFEAMAVREAMRSERQLRAILDNLPIGVLVAASPSGAIRFANAEAERLLGGSIRGEALWSQEIARGAIDASGKSLAPEDFVLYKALHQQRPVGSQLQHYRRDDDVSLQLEVTATPIRDEVDGSSLAVAAIQDVTAKLAAEEQARQAVALRDSEERFRLIAEQAPVMLWMSDSSGDFIYLNKMQRDFHGAVDGLTNDWTLSLVAEDRSKFLDQLARAQRSDEGFTMEARLQRADGEWRTVHIVACPRFNARKELIGLIGVNTDVSDARQVQHDLERINDLLEQRVAAALAQKAEAEAALMHAQRLEALGRLTGGVAHDFNNLLTVVIGALDVILRNPQDAVRSARLGEAALAAARRGERLTAQLLAFARRQPLRPQSCDLNELIRQCEPLLTRAAGDAISLKLQLCDDDAVALIDAAQFEALLLNLVVNATDASTAGGEILVQTELVEVTDLPSVSPGRYFRLNVADHGQGMSPEVLSHLFEPFFTTKPLGKGTGLGLSQVYGFVKQSGGDVQVQSALGEGTCFSIYLPIGEVHPAATQRHSVATAAAVEKLIVLLTEDDPAVARMSEAMLEDLGHSVVRAANAEQALHVLRSQQRIDVLMTDIVMPGGMNGVELAKRAAELRPELRILLSSGYAGETIEAALAHIAWPFLRKPYLATELRDALARLDRGNRVPAEPDLA